MLGPGLGRRVLAPTMKETTQAKERKQAIAQGEQSLGLDFQAIAWSRGPSACIPTNRLPISGKRLLTVKLWTEPLLYSMHPLCLFSGLRTMGAPLMFSECPDFHLNIGGLEITFDNADDRKATLSQARMSRIG